MNTLAIGYEFPTIRVLYGLAPIRLRPCWANYKRAVYTNCATALFPSYFIQFSYYANMEIIFATMIPPPVPITYPIRAIRTPTGTSAPL